MLEKCSFCKSSETIDDMKVDCSSNTDSRNENDSSSENISSEENSNVMLYGWKIVEEKITKSKVDGTFKEAVEMFKDGIKTLKEHIYIKEGR